MRVRARVRMKDIKRVCALLLALLLLLGCACAEELSRRRQGRGGGAPATAPLLSGLSEHPAGRGLRPQDRRGGHGFPGVLPRSAATICAAMASPTRPRRRCCSTTRSPTPIIALKEGDKNGYVRRAQRRLIDLGYLFGAADGTYGQNTADAVRAFQQMLIDNGVEGVTANGEADETTLHYLYSELLGFDISTPTMYNDQQSPLPARRATSTRRPPCSSTRTAARCCLTRTPPSACTPPAPPRS